MKRQPLAAGEIYHLYNRGVDKRVIYPDDSYFLRFISILRHYLKYDYPYSLVLQRRCKNSDVKSFALKLEKYRWENPPVGILSLCLMPNHFHLQVKQITEDGITIFMHRLGTAYANYFNVRNDRTGRLFQGPFKSVRVESEGQFLCLNRYIHINPTAADLVESDNLVFWKWSSLPEYLGKRKDNICNTGDVLHYFKNADDYLDFILADFNEAEREDLEKLAIDDDFGWFEEVREQKKHLKKKLMESYARG